MSYSRKDSAPNEQSRRAEIERKKEELLMNVQRVISNNQDITSLQRQANDLEQDVQLFRRKTTTDNSKKGLFSRLFSCLPCCADSEENDEKTSLVSRRK